MNPPSPPQKRIRNLKCQILSHIVRADLLLPKGYTKQDLRSIYYYELHSDQCLKATASFS